MLALIKSSYRVPTVCQHASVTTGQTPEREGVDLVLMECRNAATHDGVREAHATGVASARREQVKEPRTQVKELTCARGLGSIW